MSTITFAPAWLRALALTLAVALPLATYGQATGSVTGTVVSSINGNYLEGAEISIDALNLRTNSGRGGLFQLSGVPAGRHEVTVNYPGLNSFTTTVEVSAGASTPMIVRLESDVYTLETFKVQGSKEGMSQAVALQRISVQTKMVAAADQFGEISEGNIGEYLKFMPGVSIDYNVNDARGISLRGLSTAFTVVAVDGTPMAGASSVDDTRRFEFEQIAMNNVETTELFKTVTPDIPANATGGFVNFVTKSAFDHEEQQRITYNFSFTAPSSNFSLGRESGVWGSDREFVVRPSAELNYSRKVTEKARRERELSLLRALRRFPAHRIHVESRHDRSDPADGQSAPAAIQHPRRAEAHAAPGVRDESRLQAHRPHVAHGRRPVELV